jgi:hypothetical protein
MRSQTRILLVFAAVVSAVSSSCTRASMPLGTPTEGTTPTVGLPSGATPQAGTPIAQVGGTFVDKNNFLAFDLPDNWLHESGTQSEYYTDTFTSPDGSAKIESLVYNDGQPFEQAKNKDFALYLLNTYYSNTGKAGDINITSDQMMDNGSERFEWTSKGGGYSGQSFFELRGNDPTTFLMFTARWTGATDPATLDLVNKAIASFRIP